MLASIIQQEQQLNALLPLSRSNQSPSATLLTATNTWAEAVWAAAQQLPPIYFTQQQIQTGLQFCNQPIFVCGVHRSGTTLVRDLLDGHPALSVLPSEGTYITSIEQKLQHLPKDAQMAFICKEWLKRLANPINQPPYWVLGNTNEQHSPYVNFASVFIAWWPLLKQHLAPTNNMWRHLALQLAYASIMQDVNPNFKPLFWVDKTPTNEQYLNRLWQTFPQAKVLHVLRNPIAILASRKQMEPNTPIRVFVKDMQRSFKIASQQLVLKNPKYLCKQYEDLCGNSETTVGQIATFLGIENLPCLTVPTVAGKPTQANSSFLQPKEIGKILIDTSGKRTNNLSVKECQILAAGLGNLTQIFSYSLPEINLLHRLWLKLRYQLW